MKLKFYKIRPDAKLPVRAHSIDAGIDLFYCPDKEHLMYGMDYCVHAGESKIVPTGIKVEVPYGFMLEIKNKSSVAAKRQLLVGACVVDSGYNGEVFVNLHNIGPITRTINLGDKIAQGVLMPIVPVRFLQTNKDNLYDWYPITISDRGDGALGSTGE